MGVLNAASPAADEGEGRARRTDPSAPDAGALLEIRGLQKRYAGAVALADARLRIGHGEVHALMGQNGAGKSTLIKALTGYIERDGGEVRFLGEPFEVHSPQEAQRRGISTIYQEINLVPLLSVAENICLGRAPRRRGLLDWRAMRHEAKALLGRFDIDIDVSRPLGEFSTAVQQMTAIARAIGFSSKLVIMDEPTSSLNDSEVERLFTVIRQLKADGVSVIFVSHKLDEVYAVSDRITIMRDGRWVHTADAHALGKSELISTMLGRDVNEAHGKTTAFTHGAGGHAGDTLLRVDSIGADGLARDVSFELRRGEILGMAGLLGSGRSETARLVFGADAPTRGSMRFAGEAYRPHAVADAVEAGMAFCTEDRKVEGIFPDMSVADNITICVLAKTGRGGVLDEQKLAERAQTLIAQLGIKCSSPAQKIRELSGGNQQKVLLARWIAMQPKLLILDEPTRGIDIGAKAEIQRLIRGLVDQGQSVLMISSELDELLEGADRIVVLRDGRSVANLEGEHISRASIVDAMAHGRTASVEGTSQ
ncbi:sugar ABC transporter ATP-binding protein [Pararobbsia silviterrae]|uniref:Sugar ABC transporter ATP-binding protein n=1 Tax=Pararobbsia silviterrae TaxID=1792498 RepID=A0A494XUV1_9BURK|nr:sugar ABC transporter ATP-binding protein [Pararobbsia silviterrae]RKP51849.1 sugar ABC transporter ATP-binding protein [Pararobbsia silviterrae]